MSVTEECMRAAKEAVKKMLQSSEEPVEWSRLLEEAEAVGQCEFSPPVFSEVLKAAEAVQVRGTNKYRLRLARGRRDVAPESGVEERTFEGKMSVTVEGPDESYTANTAKTRRIRVTITFL